MTPRTPLFALALPAALAAVATAGATDPASPSLELPELVVTASPPDDPGAPQILEVSDIAPRRAATSDTARLLRALPGVHTQSAGGVSGLPVIHGLADDRLRAQVNGMDLRSACANHMNPPLSYLDPAQVESLRVFSGFVPVSQGGDSIGGAIQVDSPGPRFAEPGEETIHQGEIGIFYRSNGDVRGGQASATLAKDTLSLRYQGATVRSGNYRAAKEFKSAGPAAAGRGRLDGDEVGSSAYEATNQSLQLGLRHANHLFQFEVGWQEIGDQGFSNQRMDMTANDSTRLNARYQGQFDWGEIQAQIYREKTRHTMQFGDDKLYWYGPNTVSGSDGTPCTPTGGMNGCAAGMPMDTEGDNRGLRLEAEIDLNDRDRLRVGGLYQRYRLDDWWDPSGKGMWPEPFWNLRDGQRDRLAAFAEWEGDWTPAWQTQLGVRHEQVTMDAGEVQGYSAAFSPADQAAFNAADRRVVDHNWDLAALARFTPSATSAYALGLTSKTRSPNLYERYAWSTHGMAMRMVNWAGDGNGYVGNLELEPETALTLSASATWREAEQRRWELDFRPYYTRVEHYIDAERCDSDPDGNACNDANLTRTDGFVYLRFVNQRAHLYGFDLSGRLRLARDPDFGEWHATGQLGYVRGENDDTGDRLYPLMPLHATLGLEHRRHGWFHRLELELVDAKDQVSATRNEVETAGYGLVHWRGRYETGTLRLDFGIDNLLDRYYEDPLGGVYLGQGKTMSATDLPWGVALPGPGRSFYAGVTLKF